MKTWFKMEKNEKTQAYKYAGIGIATGFLITVLGIHNIPAGVINGILLGFVFQMFYQIRLK